MLKKIFVGAICAAFLCFDVAVGNPFIASFSPTFGASNDPSPVIITGSGFAPGTLIVKFGGANGVRDFTAGTADGFNIQARVPANAPLGPGKIYVSVNGVGVESTEYFTIIGPGPYVDSFTPTIGDSGTPVTIHGAHFFNSLQGAQYGTLQVKFTGANPITVQSADGVTITVDAPANVVSGPITVLNAKGSSVSTVDFVVPPKITGFTPSRGRSGTNVVITGANLVGVTNVQFGVTNEALNGVAASGFIVLSNGAIQVSVPANVVSGKIRLRSPAGVALSSSNFLMQPLITGFVPMVGNAGTNVTIFGANLNEGTPVVKFNGKQTAAPTGVSFAQLNVVAPTGAFSGTITITNSNGTNESAAKFYYPANISSVTPTFGSVQVTIAGTNFTDATAVKFNNVDAASFSVQNNNSIGAVVPFSVSSGVITVTTPAGVFSNTAVKYYAPPVISAFDPTHGLPGTNVTLFGQNFLDASLVLFNGTSAKFWVTNNNIIGAVVPTNASTGPITVVAPAGTNTTPVNFTLDYAANLIVTMTDTPDPVFIGSNLVYSIIVSNAGPFVAPGVTLTSALVGPAIITGASTSQGTLNTNGFPVTGALGEIGVNQNAFVTLNVTPLEAGALTNGVTVSSQYPDLVPGNNSVTNTTLIQALPLLTVRRVGSTGVRLTWHASLTNYALEYRSNLSVGNWLNVLTTPIVVGSDNQLTETNNQPARFYRLHRVP